MTPGDDPSTGPRSRGRMRRTVTSRTRSRDHPPKDPPMASADGKTNPFNADGKSGATGNKDGGSSQGLSKMQRGPDRSQKSGPPDFNPDSVSEGGRILKLDPPSDRGGLVGQTVAGMKHKPYKIGGSTTTPAKNTEVDDTPPVGDILMDPPSDQSE